MVTKTLKELNDRTLIANKRGGKVRTHIIGKLIENIKSGEHKKVMVLFHSESAAEGGYNLFKSLLNAGCYPHSCNSKFKSFHFTHASGDIQVKFAVLEIGKPDGIPYGYNSEWYAINTRGDAMKDAYNCIEVIAEIFTADNGHKFAMMYGNDPSKAMMHDRHCNPYCAMLSYDLEGDAKCTLNRGEVRLQLEIANGCSDLQIIRCKECLIAEQTCKRLIQTAKEKKC